MAVNNMINKTLPFSVTEGGTGNSTLLSHGVLVGNGSSSITSLAVGSNNSLMAGQASSDPVMTVSATPYVSGISFNSGTSVMSTYISAGTWTPSMDFSGGTSGVTYSTQQGNYIRIGNMIVVEVNLVVTSIGTSSGNAVVIGLPVNPSNGSRPTGSALFQNINFTGKYCWFVAINGAPSNGLRLQRAVSGSTGTNITAANFSGTTTITGTALYFG